MSSKKPVAITIKRVQGDTYPEKFSVVPLTDNTTSASLEVEGLGTLSGTIDLVAKTIEFPVTVSGVSDGAPGTYDYDVVITAGATTRTVVQGKWIILAREVTP